MEQTHERVWYAMRATYGRNMAAKDIADGMEIINFIPMHYVVKRGGGRVQRKFVPVIRDLIFVFATKAEITVLKQRTSYLQYITRPVNGRNEPIIVPDKQMQQFINITLSENKELIYLQPDEINLVQGTRIRIHGGEFNGYEGVFIKLKGKRNKRVVVDIDNLIALAVEISPELIEVIKE